MAWPRAAGPGRFDELLVHRFASRGTYSVSRWDGIEALGWAAPARGGAALGSLWTTRVLGDGIAALGWQPLRAGVTVASRGPMIISHGSVGFGAKKRDSSDPESGLLRPNCRSRPLIPLAVPSLGSRSRESRCGLRYE